METVPEAIIAFLEGRDFVDVIRTAVSLGGDCDTLTAIAGSIAEGFYGIPKDLQQECYSRLPDDLLAVVGKFEEHIKSIHRGASITVSDLRQQIEERKSSEQLFRSFVPTKSVGKQSQLLIDESSGRFVVLSSLHKDGGQTPDVMSISQLMDCSVEIIEDIALEAQAFLPWVL